MKLASILVSLVLLVAQVLCALPADRLAELQGPDGVIHLNDGNFKQLLSGPREYFVSLLFTAGDIAVGCAVCQKFEPVFTKTARSYHSSNPGKNAVFFFIADFADNKNTFNMLNMQQVPRTWLFPPSDDPVYNVTSPHFPYQIGDKALTDPLDFPNFISKLVNVNIVVREEFDPLQFVEYFGITFLVVLILKKKVLAKLARSAIFRLFSVLSICILTGGYMFTVIRSIPLIMTDDKGQLMYFSGGTHWQFSMETFIIAAIYMAFTLLMGALCVKIPAIKDGNRRSICVLIASFGVFWLFNTLTKVYLIKDPGYPFRLTKYF